MKKLTTVSLFIFWAVVVAILVAGILSFQNNNSSTKTIKNTQNKSQTQSPSDVSTDMNTNTNNQASKSSSTTINLKEVSKHSSPSDCWMVVNKKVYDVTSSISSHPGGAGEIIKYCGQDATKAFNTKDGSGRPHSNRANSELASYFIGNLNQTISN